MRAIRASGKYMPIRPSLFNNSSEKVALVDDGVDPDASSSAVGDDDPTRTVKHPRESEDGAAGACTVTETGGADAPLRADGTALDEGTTPVAGSVPPREEDKGASGFSKDGTSGTVRLSRAFCSWMPPSWKLTGSKMIESPRGRPWWSSKKRLPGWDGCAWCGSKGGSGSSALMPKAKHSNEKVRSRPPPVPEGPVEASSPNSKTATQQKERNRGTAKNKWSVSNEPRRRRDLTNQWIDNPATTRTYNQGRPKIPVSG